MLHRFLFLAVIVLLPATFLARDYVPVYVGAGPSPTNASWPAGAFINYQLHVGIGPGMPMIEVGSQPIPAIDAGMATIGAVTGLTMTNVGSTNQSTAIQDGLNLVTFDNNAGNVALLNGGIGVTVTYYNAGGQITEFDIIGTGAQPISTVGGALAYDIETLIAHECGHGVGLDHSPIFSATMYPTIFTGTLKGRTLSPDDLSGLASIYGTVPAGGTVTGNVVRGGGMPVIGAHLFLEDVITGRVSTGGVSIDAGAFSLQQVPPGLYRLWVEPLDSPVSQANLIGPYWGTVAADQSFRTAVLGGSLNPTVLVVRAGQTNAVGNFAVSGPAHTRDVTQVFFIDMGTPFGSTSTLETQAPYIAFMGIFGTGVDVIADAGYQISGPFHQITGPNTWATSQPAFDDKIFPISIAAEAPPGGYLLRVDDVITGETITFPGCVEVLPPASPQAYTAPYGPSATGSGGPLSLSATGQPSLGNVAFSLDLSGTVAGETAYYIFSGLPDAVGLLPGVVLGVDLNTLLFPLLTIGLPTGGPTLSFPIAVPNDPALAGLDVFLQVLMTDGGSVFGATLSNGLAIHFE